MQLNYNKKNITFKTYCHSENDHITANGIALTSRTGGERKRPALCC